MFWSIKICTVILIKATLIKSLERLDDGYKTVVHYQQYGKNCNLSVDSSTEHIIRYPSSKSKHPYTVYSWSDQAYTHHPAFVVARQEKEILAWQIPLPVYSHSGLFNFPSVSRILCHNDMDVISTLPRNDTHNNEIKIFESVQFHKELSISISTYSNSPIPLTIRVEEHDDFYVIEDIEYSMIISPATPKYYYYKFHEKDSGNYSGTVIVEVNSEDDVCLSVSIQPPKCPAKDLDNKIVYKAKYQTVDTKGGIIIKRTNYPDGFFIVFTAKGDNYECTKTSSISSKRQDDKLNSLNRTSSLKFSVRYGLSKGDYLIASFSTLAIFFGFYIVFIGITWAFIRFGTLKEKPVVEDIPLQTRNDNGQANAGLCDEIDATLASSSLTLNDLAKKNSDYVEKKTFAYLWHVISIALFYGIPVVQLVITYQRIVNVSGNQDICYYNFLCAYPLFGFSDFNHIYSNIGYVLVGGLFLGITFYKERKVPYYEFRGIPKHYGLFYAMGVALIMEGVLSACYHICPNQSNFQFDTSFMYVMAVLIMVKIYQNRHPDLNATSNATFLILGLVIFLAMIGILNGHIAIWIIFIILHIILCFYLSFNVYFLSYIKRGVVGVFNDWNEDRSIKRTFEPKRKAHFLLLVIANVINIILANLGILYYFIGVDFATFLLGLLMGNAILYMVVYIIMKLIHNERICLQAIIYGLLGLGFWIWGTYYFLNNSTAWTVTAAKSRKKNMHCTILEFYDFHDIWHLLSAAALFFSFMFLLSLDDDLIMTHHKDILVF